MSRFPIRDGRPISVAVFGYGVAGRVFHTPLIAATPGLELAAVVTPEPDQAAQARAVYGDIVVSSAEAAWLLADRLDVAVISTPNFTHVPLARAAIKHGLALVVDKPMAPSSSDARALLREAAAAAAPLTVFQNRRWDGDFQTVAQLVREGALGDIHQFESRFSWWSPGGRPGWKGSTPVSEGGGALYDLGPHLIDQAVRLFGAVVESFAELDAWHPQSRSDDDTFVALTHESGVRSRLWMSTMTPLAGPRLRVVGSAACFVSQDRDPQEAHSNAGLRPNADHFGSWAAPGILGSDGGTRQVQLRVGRYLSFYEQLERALRGLGDLPVDPTGPIEVLEVIESLHRRFPVQFHGDRGGAASS